MIKNIIFDLGNVILKDKPSIILENLNLGDEVYNDIKENFFNTWSKLDLGLISLEDFFYQCKFKSIVSDNIKEKLPHSYNLAKLLGSYLFENYEINLTDEEIGFIALHIDRLVKNSISFEK